MRQPHCGEQPLCIKAALFLWGSLIDVRYPHCCEVPSIFEAAILMQFQGYWGCLTKLAALGLPYIAWNTEGTSLRLLLWGYLIFWWIFANLAREFPLSWFLNLLILVPQARLPCLQLGATLYSLKHWGNLIETTSLRLFWLLVKFSPWITSFMVPQSPYSGSASTLAVLAIFYNSACLKHWIIFFWCH